MFYILKHSWKFNDSEGCYMATFSNVEEAFERFEYLKKLIECDDYDFDVKFTPYCEGDMEFSAYENSLSLVNRQDLILMEVEVR